MRVCISAVAVLTAIVTARVLLLGAVHAATIASYPTRLKQQIITLETVEIVVMPWLMLGILAWLRHRDRRLAEPDLRTSA